MTKDSKNSPRNDTWRKRAEGYNRFEPDRGKTRPSEWFIMWYLLLYFFGRSIKVEKAKGEDGDDDSREDGWSASEYETSSSSSSFEEDSEASGSFAESSRKKAWISWVRKRFKKSEATSASASVVESIQRVRERSPQFRTDSALASNEEPSQDKSWVSWLRRLFRKAENDREKRGPSTV